MRSSRFAIDRAAAAAALLSCGVSGAQPIIGGQPLAAGPASRWTLEGPEAALIAGVRLEHAGEPPIAAVIEVSEADRLVLRADTSEAPTGFYALVAFGDGFSLRMPDAVEVSRPPWIELGGAPSAAISLPLATGTIHASIEVIVPRRAFAGRGPVEGLEFFTAGTSPVGSASITVRARSEGNATFATADFPPPNYFFTAQGTIFGDGSAGVVQVGFDTVLHPPLTSSMALNVVATRTVPFAGNAFEAFSSPGACRFGISNTAGSDPLAWQGSTPTARFLSDVQPRMRLRLLAAPLEAGYAPSATIATVDDAIAFTSSSPDDAAHFWDFDRNGTVDSEERNPVYQFSLPGTYRPELVVVREGCADGVLSPTPITITGPPVSTFAIQ